MSNYPDVKNETQLEFIPQIPDVLPMNHMYAVQVGSKLYKISGASLSSDAPSYFTNYFSDSQNSDQVLFIDRSPEIFDKIVSHLQGYFINVKDGIELNHLYCDACYFNLPRLKGLLKNSDMFAQIGTRNFRIPKKLFKAKGNSPNFFTISYDSIFTDISSVLNDLNLIRPPVQAPIILADRSPDLFDIILNYLQGNEIEIASDSLRKSLVKECRYYRFLELEQRFIKAKTFWDFGRNRHVILLNIDYIKPRQLIMVENDNLFDYSRPFLDTTQKALYFEIASDHMFATYNKITFYSDARIQFTKVFRLVIQKFPEAFVISESEISVKFQGNMDAFITFEDDENFDISHGTTICIKRGQFMFSYDAKSGNVMLKPIRLECISASIKSLYKSLGSF